MLRPPVVASSILVWQTDSRYPETPAEEQSSLGILDVDTAIPFSFCSKGIRRILPALVAYKIPNSSNWRVLGCEILHLVEFEEEPSE